MINAYHFDMRGFRCILKELEQIDGKRQFGGFCIDNCVAVQADSFEEAEQKLEESLNLLNEDDHKIMPKARLGQRLKYYFLKAADQGAFDISLISTFWFDKTFFSFDILSITVGRLIVSRSLLSIYNIAGELKVDIFFIPIKIKDQQIFGYD